MKMELKLAVYNFMVNRVPGIRDKYKEKRNRAKGIGRIGVWLYLIGLNISYYILGNKKLAHREKFPIYEKKELYGKGSESSISKLEEPELFAARLAEYEVISFDVFDTLVLRPFSKPTDLFFILGEQLGYLDFERIRQEMEWRVREKKYKKKKHYEVTLEEIYDVLSKETGIPKNTMEMEEALENQLCFANPYMIHVIEELCKKNKRIIITSDMYLNKEQIKNLLETCGYPQFAAYYVSCDLEKSKSTGTIFEEIKKYEGKEVSYIHIGDNYIADVEQPQKYGFETIHYVNVNAVGMPYRPEDMSAVIGGAYRGIVNASIHNGWKEYSREYEYGYIYGGLFAMGYCRFIHDYVKVQGIEKILFLARDGDVLKKVYEKMYPEEVDKCEYVYWSRVAATKMAAGYFKYDYFRRFLYHKVNQKYTLEQIFASMEISDMLKGFCRKEREKPQVELTDRNVEVVKQYLMEHWNEVLNHYKEQLIAGKQYYKEILKECKTAVAVDIGWAGSGAVTLHHIVNQIWNLDCSITGIIAGTNSCHNMEMDASESLIQSGKLVSYLYSQRENRDLWKRHDAGKDYNLYWEMLLDAPHGSLKGFYLDEKGDYYCKFKEYNEKKEILEIQQGILEFVSEYMKHFQRFDMFFDISGRDAYAPMLLALSEDNKSFRKQITSLIDEVNLT